MRNRLHLVRWASFALLVAGQTVAVQADVLVLDANGNYVPSPPIKVDVTGSANLAPASEADVPETPATDDDETSNTELPAPEPAAAGALGAPALPALAADGPAEEAVERPVELQFAQPTPVELDLDADPTVYAFPAPLPVDRDARATPPAEGDALSTAMPALELQFAKPPDDAAPGSDASVVEASTVDVVAVLVAAEAAKHDNLDAAFVTSVIEAESNYDITAVSPKGAMGLMQLMPATAERYDVVNPFSPEDNIRAGTAELSRLMAEYRNPALALAAYNAGQAAVEQYDGVPPFRETQEFIVRVLTKTFAKREAALRAEGAGVAEGGSGAGDATEPDPLFAPMNVQSFDW